MKCNQLAPVQGCLRRESGPPESVLIHYEYRNNADGNAIMHAIRVTDALGVPVIMAGTDVLSVGVCGVDDSYTSFFGAGFITGASGSVPIPSNVYDIQIFNATGASIVVTTPDGDTQGMPAYSSLSFSKDVGKEPPFGAGNVVTNVVVGTIGATEQTIINYKVVQ